MIKNKLVCILLFAVVISSVSFFSSATTIPEEDQEQSEVITIQSVNDQECGLCDVHIETSFNPDYMKKDYPHTVPVAVIKIWTETACNGNEFHPDCGDDDNDDNGDPYPPALPDSSEPQAQDVIIEQEENEIKNILFGNDEGAVGCSLCADSFEQELIGVDGSISLFDEQQLSQTGAAPSGVVNLDSSQSESVEAISIEAQPLDTCEPANPCWFQPEDGASVTFYPPENVYVYPEAVGIGCGVETYVTLSVRSDDESISGPIKLRYSSVSINSFDTPFVSCSGMNICGVATANGYGEEDPNLPYIMVNLNNQGPNQTVPPVEPTDFSGDYSELTVGRNAIFDASSLDDGGSSNAVYSWDFGDGAVSDGGIEASHVYETPGEYTVKVTVEKEGTLLDEGAADVYVTEETTTFEDGVVDPVIEENDDVTNDKTERSPSFIDMILQMIQDILSRVLG